MKQNYLTIFLLLAICLSVFNTYGQGARYTGNYTPSSPIQHVGKTDFVIEGLEISTTGDEGCITLYNCENVIIRNSKFGPSHLKRAIYLYGCRNVTIVDCTFENVQSALIAGKSEGIKFEYNDVTNVLGKLKGSKSVGVMAQFNGVSGAGNSISYNVCENIPGESSTEDIISLFDSSGTLQSPIMVKSNWIRGGGPSLSGGGINLGDMNGSYQIAEDNILVNPGQYGIGISGGNNMILRNNKVYGRRSSITNVGATACNWYREIAESFNITVAGNRINFTHRDGFQNNWWYAGNMEPVAGKETNVFDAGLNETILPDQIIGRARLFEEPDEEVIEEPATGVSLPDINNHPSISIYLDKYNRVCVNSVGKISPDATITAANAAGEIIYSQSLIRYHTVLPYRPYPGTYYILVRNGKKAHLKMLNIL